MARFGSGHLKDIDEQFCQCPICLQQYREPKLLPCLHRYCSDCLKELIEKNQVVKAAKCPKCSDEFTIPENGVDGFKTDFYMENIIEYIQIQRSLEDEKVQECYSCSRKSKVSAFCFKCNGVLCDQCHNIHVTSKSLKDHKQHTVSLEDFQSKDMTLEKLSDLKEAPRCESHPEDLCRLCCKTCVDLPICMKCTYGSHNNHNIVSVEIIAAEESKKLTADLQNIDQYRERLLKLSNAVDRNTKDHMSNVRKETENNTKRYDKDMNDMKMEIKRAEDKYSILRNEIEEEKNAKLTEMNKQMDEEMKLLRLKYDNICEEIEEESRVKLANLKHEQEVEIQISREKLAILEKDFQTFIKTLGTRQEDGLAKLQEISLRIHVVKERYSNLTTFGYGVLETKNDWTAVQCIPAIRKAIEPLSVDIKRDFPELDSLPRIEVGPEVTENEEFPVNIEGMEANGWGITGMTCAEGSIVVTGHTSENYQSHVTVINMKGNVLRKYILQQRVAYPDRYCACLSGFKVATVCDRNEIGIFDTRNATYIKKDVSDVTSNWPVKRSVWCVATDPVTNHIFVGGEESKDVYVFDDQLNFHHTLTFPEITGYPYDIIIKGDNLLICDCEDGRAYICSTKKRVGKVIHEFKKPDFGRSDWKPISVCKTSNDFIYILWGTIDPQGYGRRVVTQYTPGGSQLLKTLEIDSNDARCITKVNEGQKEKLLVANWKSGKLFIYKLT